MRGDTNRANYESVEDYVRRNPNSLGAEHIREHDPLLRDKLQRYETPGVGIAPEEVIGVLTEVAQRGSTGLPTGAADRKAVPIASGVLDYFPAALAEIARVSKAGNDQHNAGQPLHWARGKSTDQSDCLIRHFLERGTVDSDGFRHSAKMAWRALALLQLELEAEGAPVARGAK